MLRLLLSKAPKYKDFWKTSKPCHVGIHWIALTEYSEMSTHVQGFQSIFSVFFHYFVLAKLASQLCERLKSAGAERLPVPVFLL